jgi:hypothetical protein
MAKLQTKTIAKTYMIDLYYSNPLGFIFDFSHVLFLLLFAPISVLVLESDNP